MTTPNPTLDARLARAMGWIKVPPSTDWCKPGQGPVKTMYWSPSLDENHFAEVMREIERKGLGLTFAVAVLNADKRCANQPITKCWFLLLSVPLETRCLAAAETLEGANG